MHLQCRYRGRLRDGGLFLNHGITHEKFWKRTSQTDFLERLVFPNAEMDNITNIMDGHVEWTSSDRERMAMRMGLAGMGHSSNGLFTLEGTRDPIKGWRFLADPCRLCSNTCQGP